MVEHRLRAAQAYARHNELDRVVGAAPGASLGIVCAGKTYFDVVQALADLGVSLDDLDRLGIRVLKLAMTYPLVPETVTQFADSVDTIVVIEEKRPFVETQLRSILHEARSTVAGAGQARPRRRGVGLVGRRARPDRGRNHPHAGPARRSRRTASRPRRAHVSR